MARLIEVRETRSTPSRLILETGDLLMFAATGGQVRSGADVVNVLGPFSIGILVVGGQILTPHGPPNTVFFLARGPGRARIEVITGDPWGAHETILLEVVVGP